MIKTLFAGWLLAVATLAAGLAVYHTRWVQPAQAIGVVDISDIYHAKEREYSDLLSRTGATDEGQHRAREMAGQFAAALPKALTEMPAECQCLVLLRSAVVGDTPTTVDLTPLLRRKLGMS